MKFLVVIEKSSTGFSAYLPDVPGCIATGSTQRQVEGRIRSAMEMHLEGLKSAGLGVPEPQSTSTYVEVSA